MLVGVNGSGKTSLLRAIAVAMGGWAHAYIKDQKNRRPIDGEEIRDALEYFIPGFKKAVTKNYVGDELVDMPLAAATGAGGGDMSYTFERDGFVFVTQSYF